MLCFQAYVNVPKPVELTLSVNAAGSPPLHIVWELAMVPPVKVFTVTMISLLFAVQDTPLAVLVVIRLYVVVAVKPDGAS